ncbi:MAG: MarR family transcriptional regulator [Streptosporangiales bacterium]|nr:MarR family transcriptional regulator [Streptosporangiales bacterium]
MKRTEGEGQQATDAGLEWILMRLATRLERLQTEALAGLSEPVTFRQYRILARVRGGHTSLTGLAHALRRSLPTVSASVDILVKRGLLTRDPAPNDRRLITLGVTRRGVEVLEEGRVTLESLTSALTAHLPDQDREVLTKALTEIYDLAGTYLNPRT